MPHNYGTYTEISAQALDFNPKSQELIAKKVEIIKSISDHHGKNPNEILFYGFSPLLLAVDKPIFLTACGDEVKKWLTEQGVKYTYIAEDDLGNYRKKFSWVIAVEEYFTFASDEDQQRQQVEKLLGLAKDLVLTTLKDYKNQDFRDREFSSPLAVRNGKNTMIFLEYHDHDYSDKNSWSTSVYTMQGPTSKLYGPFARRSMFFKQLAKFSLDAGARDFYVHKNLMYKSVIKKNYEHVISISV